MKRTLSAAPARRILTRRQLAEVLGVSERTIVRMEHDGYLPPPVRLGSKRVGHWSDTEPLSKPSRPNGRRA